MKKLYVPILTLCILAFGLCNLTAAETMLNNLNQSDEVRLVKAIKSYGFAKGFIGSTVKEPWNYTSNVSQDFKDKLKVTVDEAKMLSDNDRDFNKKVEKFINNISQDSKNELLGWALDTAYHDGVGSGWESGMVAGKDQWDIAFKDVLKTSKKAIEDFKNNYGQLIEENSK